MVPYISGRSSTPLSCLTASFTSGLIRYGTLKHDHPAHEWRLVPLGHRNSKWNQTRSNYSNCDQELLPRNLVLSSQSTLLSTNTILWLCDQELVKPLQKGPRPEKVQLKWWWTYLSQFRFDCPPYAGYKERNG